MLLIFDCDGVLVDSEVISNRVLAAHLSRHGFPLTAKESQTKFLGRTIPGVIQMVAEEGVDLPSDFEATLRERDIEAFDRELEPVAGMEQALEALSGTAMCVASSGSPEKIRRNLESTGLLRYFEPHMFSAHDVKNSKPAPDLFLHAANRLGFDPATCIVIEDSPLGVEGGKRAGMKVLGFIGASHRNPEDEKILRNAGADLVFSDMRQLPSLI